jgi:hypothetical protein
VSDQTKLGDGLVLVGLGTRGFVSVWMTLAFQDQRAVVSGLEFFRWSHLFILTIVAAILVVTVWPVRRLWRRYGWKKTSPNVRRLLRGLAIVAAIAFYAPVAALMAPDIVRSMPSPAATFAGLPGPAVISAIGFTIGVVAQGAWATWGAWSVLRLLVVSPTAIIVWFITAILPTGSRRNPPDPLLALFVVLLFGLVAIAALFRERILPRVGIHSLIALTVAFWIAVGLSGAPTAILSGDPFAAALSAAYAAGTLFTIALVVRRGPAPGRWHAAAFIWYLGLIVGIGVLQFPLSQIKFFVAPHPAGPPFLESLSLGLLFSYISLHLWYLVDLVPLKGRGESWAEVLQGKRELLASFTRHYVDAPIRRWQVGVLAVGAGVLALAAWRDPETGRIFVALWVVLMPSVAAPAAVPDLGFVAPRARGRPRRHVKEPATTQPS